MQLICIIERVARLVPQIHHGLAIALQIIIFFFDLGHIGPRQVKRNPNHRLARRASPFIGQITRRAELKDFFLRQLLIKLLHEFFELRSLYRQAQIANPRIQKRAGLIRPSPPRLKQPARRLESATAC